MCKMKVLDDEASILSLTLQVAPTHPAVWRPGESLQHHGLHHEVEVIIGA